MLLNVILLNKFPKGFAVRIANWQKYVSDLYFVLVNGVDGLQGDNKGIVDPDKLIGRQCFLHRFQPLKADNLLLFGVNCHVVL